MEVTISRQIIPRVGILPLVSFISFKNWLMDWITAFLLPAVTEDPLPVKISCRNGISILTETIEKTMLSRVNKK
jgi:hypothetical protein